MLFLPVSGPKGSGEFYRSLTIARAARERWPQAEIAFMVSRSAGYAEEARAGPHSFNVQLLDSSPTFNTAAVNRFMAAFRPDVVLFDSSGRRAQLLCARRLGVRTVYISSRQKALRLRRMRLLDQHWQAWPEFLGRPARAWGRLKLRFAPALEVVPLGVVFPPYEAARASALLSRLGLAEGGYLFFCAGGGGYSIKGRTAPEIFAEAAARIAKAAGVPVVFVRGSNYTGPRSNSPGVIALDSLDTPSLIDVLACARTATVNGGSLLLQALALKVPSIAAPVAWDQRRRIGTCAAHGLTIPAALDAEALAAATGSLLTDSARQMELRHRLEALNMTNGVKPAIAALERLLDQPHTTRGKTAE